MNYYNECDPHAAAWLRQLIADGLIPAGDVDSRSIADVRAGDLSGYAQCHFFAGIGGWSLALELAHWPEDRPVWTGSCPCQPFSNAGKGLGTADERHLWPVFHRLIRECRPHVVFGEQVAAAIGKRWLDGVCADLEADGYACGAVVLGAHSVGAPHIRQRLYWVANAGSLRRDPREPGDGRAEAGPWSEHGQVVDRCGRLDNPDDARCHRTEPNAEGQARHEARLRLPSAGRSAGRLGHALVPGLEGHPGNADHRHQPGRDGAQPARPATEAGSAGAWSNFVLLHCADGKARRIITRPAWMADGISRGVDDFLPNEKEKVIYEKATTRPGENMRPLRRNDGAPSIQQRDTGGSNSVQPSEVLRSDMHGPKHDGGNQSAECGQQPKAISSDGRTTLRDLWDYIESSCPPHRLQPDEQRTLESADVVRALSSAIALADIEGDQGSSSLLHALLAACKASGTLRYTRDAFTSEWRSASAAHPTERPMGIDSGQWRIVPIAPLIRNAAISRTTMLRGYGNAIVPQLAAEFVAAFLETSAPPVDTA